MVTDGLKTKDMSNETADQKWLKALAGKIAGKAASSHLEIGAKAIRNSLIRQSKSRPAYEPSERHFQKILSEANKRGLFNQEKTLGGLGIILRSISEFLTMPAAVMASVTFVFGLSVTVGWQAHEINSSEEMAVRGGASVENISLIVPSLKETARGWQKDLLAAGIEHTVSFEQPSRILIRMKLTPDAIRLLEEGKRIQPLAGAWITMVIELDKGSK